MLLDLFSVGMGIPPSYSLSVKFRGRYMLQALWDFLVKNNGPLGFALAFLTACWAVWNYFSIKRAEEETRQFQAFHQMIKGLVQGDNEKIVPFVDQQLAVIYELRNFPQYYPVILRILERSKESWSGWWADTLINEADLTIDYIRRRGMLESHYLRQCWYLPRSKD